MFRMHVDFNLVVGVNGTFLGGMVNLVCKEACRHFI
jgi:hypothetical protein